MERLLIRLGIAALALGLVLGLVGDERASLVVSLLGVVVFAVGLRRNAATRPNPAEPKRMILCHALLVVAMIFEVLIVSDYPAHWAVAAIIFAAWVAGLTHWSRRLPLPL
jgi:hypothetical protein